MTDSVGSPLQRLGARFQPSQLSLGASAARELSFEELRALSSIDDVLRPEDLDLVRSQELFASGATSDLRRLPPPPVRAPDGQTLYRTLSRFLDGPQAKIAADPEALRKEAALRALLGGIHGLEAEIRERMSRGRCG